MKPFLVLALLVAPVLTVSAQQRASVPMSIRTIAPVTTNTTADAEADRDHEALWSAWRAKPPGDLTRTNRAYWEWQDKVFIQFAKDAATFAEKHPKDPRRWEALVQSGYTPPWFIKGFKPEFDTQPAAANLIVDEKAQAAFKEHQTKVNREVMLAEDSTPRQRSGAFGWMFTEAGIAARKEGKQPELGQFKPLMNEVAVKLPDERGAELVATYLEILRTSSPDEAKDFEASLADKPIAEAIKERANKMAQARAEAKEALLKATADIGSIKFTSADGRPVDLSLLRGKVVLIDFWATWCGPCIKEIPNIVANYEKYHDKGFEVIGITLENSNLAGDEKTDDLDKKLAAAKQKMLAFTKKNSMPWPQHFDGLYWKNEYAVKYGIHGIPAMFLLDKDGRVASTEARGPELESEIKRLLNL